MSTIVNSTLYKRCTIWGSDTQSSNPDYRHLSSTSSQKVLVRQRTGNAQPKYRQLVKEQKNATTYLSAVSNRAEGQNSSVFMTYMVGSAVHEVKSDGPHALHAMGEPSWSSWPSTAASRASSKALKDVRSFQQSVSGPTFLGELRETLRMLRKPAAALHDLCSQYLNDLERRNLDNRRRNFKKGRTAKEKRAYAKKYAYELERAASGLWLERSLGWVPLLSDINDALEGYSELIDVPRVRKFSASGTDSKLTYSSTDSYNVFPPGSKAYRLRHRQVIDTEVCRYRGAVTVQAATTAADYAARFGFTPGEFIPTAWELLPWSFLFDYFSNIGDILEALVTDTSSVRWLSYSVIRETKSIARDGPDLAAMTAAVGGSKNVLNQGGSPGFAMWVKRTVSRSSVGQIAFPTFYLEYPPFIRRDGSVNTKWFNIAALLGQAQANLHTQQPRKRNYRL